MSNPHKTKAELGNDSSRRRLADIGAMDILFIYPSYGDSSEKARLLPTRISDDVPNQESPNIGIGYLIAVAKRAGIKAKFIDMVFDDFSPGDVVELVKLHRPAMVGFTAFTTHIKPAGVLAAMIKSAVPGTKVSVGGPHAAAMPRQTLEEFEGFDFAICGEAEDTLVAIMDQLNNDEALSKVPGVVLRGRKSIAWVGAEDLDSLPFPAWEEFDLPSYGGLYPHRTKRELPILAQRGCPYKCNFCMRASGDTVRMRSVGSVIAEIEHDIEAFGCESMAFLDETFALNKKWTREFFDVMKKRGLNKKVSWACSTRVSHTTESFFHEMRDAGGYYTFFGLESADEEVLSLVDKRINIQDMKNSIKWAKEAGIIPVGAFIIGLAKDNEITVQKAIDLGLELDLWSITFPIAVPFPGTGLRTLAERNEYGMHLLSNDWDRYGKQEGGVMESDDLSFEMRKAMQNRAYDTHPKKDLQDYIETRLT